MAVVAGRHVTWLGRLGGWDGPLSYSFIHILSITIKEIHGNRSSSYSVPAQSDNYEFPSAAAGFHEFRHKSRTFGSWGGKMIASTIA
jgi:hypothetical protein